MVSLYSKKTRVVAAMSRAVAGGSPNQLLSATRLCRTTLAHLSTNYLPLIRGSFGANHITWEVWTLTNGFSENSLTVAYIKYLCIELVICSVVHKPVSSQQLVPKSSGHGSMGPLAIDIILFYNDLAEIRVTVTFVSSLTGRSPL